MSANMDTAEAVRLLNASFGTTAYVAPTTPMKNRLMSVNGSAGSNGTEVVGGSYASQTIAVTTAVGTASVTNSGTITYTAMPAITTTGIEIWDSAGSPRREWQGALTAPKTTGAGDTLSFATSAISIGNNT